MRFNFQLEFQGEPPFVMPANYQYELSECINKIIHFNNKEFINKLEKDGYLDQNHQFNFFSFSHLDFKDYRQENDRLVTDNSEAEMLITILVDDNIGKKVIDLFTGKELRFGDDKNKVILSIKAVDKQPGPEFSDSMDFKLITPVVIKNEEGLNKKTRFLSPDDKDYERLFIKSLMAKYALLMKSVKSGFAPTINSNFSQLKFNCKSKPVSRIVKVNGDNHKPVSVKGYLFDFAITAPAGLIKLGYYSGYGEHNNYGFGFCVIR